MLKFIHEAISLSVMLTYTSQENMRLVFAFYHSDWQLGYSDDCIVRSSPRNNSRDKTLSECKETIIRAASVYSTYPKELSRELWYQTFIYIYFAIFALSSGLHALLLWHTSHLIKFVYGLLAINITCYTFMHWQRNVFNIHEHNWTWDAYTWTVVPTTYTIAGLLIFASLKIGNKRQWQSNQQT